MPAKVSLETMRQAMAGAFAQTCSVIDGVIYEHLKGAHDDHRRTITPFFNGDFVAEQVKIATIKEDASLAAHSHPYNELFTVLSGRVTFFLRGDDGVEVFVLTPGLRLMIPEGTEHAALAEAGSILVGATTEMYTSAEDCDIDWEEAELFFATAAKIEPDKPE